MVWMNKWFVAGLLTSLTACGGEKEFLAVPTDVVADVAVSERAAFEAGQALGQRLCGALEAHDVGRLESVVSGAGFRIRQPGTQAVEVATADVRSAVRAGRADDNVAALEAFERLANEWLDGIEDVERCKLKSDLFRLESSGKSAYALFDLKLAGRAADGAPRQTTVRLAARLQRVEESWRFARIDVERSATDRLLGPGFRDVSSLAGIDLFRSDEKAASLLTNLGNVNVTNMGGVTVADFDGNGADDLLVYNVRSLISLFLNDGVGGFERVPQDRLPPAGTTGMFYLYLDFDNDGRRELLSSEPLTCGTGRDRVPLYRFERGRFVDAGGELRVDYGCDDRHAHIAVHDVDDDGLLDVFFSNYGLAKRDRALNHSDAVDGGRNRLFRNLGGLRFEEVTDDIGIDASTRRTLLGQWFDFTGDGRRDLMLINDFSENELYVATASGRLEKRAYPPLTDVGFSMGISVADFDNDADFDVFVSKMYSYAGQRVLAVTTDLTKPQRARLEAMAAGNTLYENLGGGRYRDVAAERGVENAQWAWGGVFFDYDNDGDRDLHVVNGMASHPDPSSKRVPDN